VVGCPRVADVSCVFKLYYLSDENASTRFLYSADMFNLYLCYIYFL